MMNSSSHLEQFHFLFLEIFLPITFHPSNLIPIRHKRSLCISFGNGFVIPSTSMSFDLTRCTSTMPSSTTCMMNLCLRLMCFVLAWKTGFFARSRDPLLSPTSFTLSSHPKIVCTRPLRYIASLAASVPAMYSASVVLKATVFCTFVTHEIGDPF